MGVYKKAVITEAGEALAARAVSGEVTIQFSHSGTSSYAYSEGTNLKKLTELQDVKQTVIPSNVQIANDTLISIRSMFDNSEITQEYLIQNVGIYASDGETEILFAVCQAATPDQMPAFNGVAPSSFIYNVQISIAQAEQLSISISTAGTATVQDVLDLEKKMEEKKLDSSGGDASDTVASVEEPDSEEEKYPDIGSKGSMKNILGNLYRWVKNLKADKVDSAGGDTAETVVSEFEASSENFPVPAVKEKAKTRWGKVKKFGDDFRAWMTGVCLLGHIVNNCVTNNPNLPLSAAQGKALMDLYTVLNTKLQEKSIVATYDIPDRDGVSTKPDYISTGFHNVTQYSNGQYIYSIQAFVYPTSLKDSVIGNIPAQYMHIKQDVYSYCYDMTGNRFLLIRITPSGEIRLETLNGTAIPQSEVRMRGSIVF